MIAPDSDYWPLPWYLREFDNVGWWPQPPPDPLAPVMVLSASLNPAPPPNDTHVSAGIYQLRPGVFLELRVEKNLWDAYLRSKSNVPH